MSAATPTPIAAAPAPLRRWRHLGPILLFGAFALAPIAAKFGAEGYILSLLSRVLILGLAAMSLDLIIGFGGLISFGHAAFLGIGAYAVAIASSHGVDDGLVQLGFALGGSALFALATGTIALRTQGVSFIMITLAFGQMLFFLVTSLAAYGGDDGLTLGRRSQVFGWPVLHGESRLYWVSFGCALATYLLGRRLVGSRFGRVLRGTRENAVRMEAIGFSPHRYQLVAYVLSGMVAGLAGFLLANQSEFVSPATMNWPRSGDLIFMAVLGGLGTLWGALLGAAVFLLSEEVLSGYTEHWRIVFGPLLVLAVLFARNGLVGVFGRGPS